MYQFIPADYTKSASTFEETVEADATSFKPMGEKLAAYVRPSGAYVASKLPKGKGKGKGKGKANGGVIELDVAEDSPDAVVYEVYKVGLDFQLSFPSKEIGMASNGSRRHGVLQDSKSTTDACSCSSCSSSREGAMSM